MKRSFYLLKRFIYVRVWLEVWEGYVITLSTFLPVSEKLQTWTLIYLGQEKLSDLYVQLYYYIIQ